MLVSKPQYGHDPDSPELLTPSASDCAAGEIVKEDWKSKVNSDTTSQ